MTTPDGAPVLRVVRGAPTAEEIAALVAVLAARPAAPPAAVAPRPAWRDLAARLGPPAAPGRGGWRGSALPR